MEVTFWGSSNQARVSAWGHPRTSKLGRLITISDGKKRHFIDRTLGDLTKLKSIYVADNKDASQKTLAKASVSVPSGVSVNAKQRNRLSQFLSRSTASRFVVKPSISTMAKDFHGGLSKDAVQRVVEKANWDTSIVQEHIDGYEFRVYVVGGKVAGAYKRPGAYVTGNGKDSVARLITDRNRRKQSNPMEAPRPIELARVAMYLAQSGKTLDFVPVLGQQFRTGITISQEGGAVTIGGRETVPEFIAREAIDACEAIGLPNAGVDVLVGDNKAYILECNARASILRHSFPEYGDSSGNAIAEAIVDFYFPQSGPIDRNANLRIDIAALKRAFEDSGTATKHVAQVL